MRPAPFRAKLEFDDTTQPLSLVELLRGLLEVSLPDIDSDDGTELRVRAGFDASTEAGFGASAVGWVERRSDLYFTIYGDEGSSTCHVVNGPLLATLLALWYPQSAAKALATLDRDRCALAGWVNHPGMGQDVVLSCDTVRRDGARPEPQALTPEIPESSAMLPRAS